MVEAEESQPKKKKWKKKRKLQQQLAAAESDAKPDSFEVDVKDDRFSALFVRPVFNIDPSEPNFKKTKAMELPINSIRFIQAGPSRFIPSSFAALFPSSSSDSYESIESQGSTCRFFACHLRHNQAKLPVYQIC